jgi:hypothetical protein
MKDLQVERAIDAVMNEGYVFYTKYVDGKKYRSKSYTTHEEAEAARKRREDDKDVEAVSAVRQESARPKPALKESCDELAAPRSSKVKADYIQYIQQENTFKPVGVITIVPKLEPCAYNVGTDQNGLPIFVKTESRTDELYMFESSAMHKVVTEIDHFWTLKDNFSKLGYMHNRGILMYGPPGTGKSSVIQQVAESMVKSGDVLLFARGVYGLQESLKAMRQVEPTRRALVVLEDLDEYVGHQERDLLQLLDGQNQVDNVLYLGTTNYLERFPARLLRPGRFDKKILIPFPPVEGRLVYLQKKLEGVETPERIKQIAEKTQGFSFGHLRELVISGWAFKEDIDETIARLRDIDYTKLPERDPKVIESVRVTKAVLKG